MPSPSSIRHFKNEKEPGPNQLLQRLLGSLVVYYMLKIKPPLVPSQCLASAQSLPNPAYQEPITWITIVIVIGSCAYLLSAQSLPSCILIMCLVRSPSNLMGSWPSQYLANQVKMCSSKLIKCLSPSIIKNTIGTIGLPIKKLEPGLSDRLI